MALSVKHSIPSSSGFGHVLSKPEFKVNKGNYLIFAKQNSENIPRLGVSVRKADYKLATHRNVIKRRIKNSFMKRASKFPAFDFVVLVKPGEQVKAKDGLEVLWRDIEDLKVG